MMRVLNVARCVPGIDDPAGHGPAIGASALRALLRCTQLRKLNLDGHRNLDVEALRIVEELVIGGVRVTRTLYRDETDDVYG